MLTPNDERWLNEKFDALHREHQKIIDKIGQQPVAISPELEAQINQASKLAGSIDAKVPDKTTPPSPHKVKGKRRL